MSSDRKRTRRARLVRPYRILIIMVVLGVAMIPATPSPAVHTCAKELHKSVLSYTSNKTAWHVQSQSWLAVNAYWPWEHSWVADTGPCQDVNVKVINSPFPSVSVRSMYYSSINLRWTWGSVGWQTATNTSFRVTISDIARGTPIWTCASTASEMLDIHT